jgi:ribosomal protein S18 acetylase RimI-like enzyme
MVRSANQAVALDRDVQHGTDAYRLEVFGLEGVAGPASLLAKMHRELLPTSPVIALGPRFLADFYYGLLPADELMFGAIAYVGEQPAGFIVATDDSTGFARAGALAHWWTLCRVLALSVIESPMRLFEMGRAVRLLRSRPRIDPTTKAAEILSLGVSPEFRTPAFVRSTGIRISLDLLQSVMDALRQKGAREVRAYVDADNRPAQLFYSTQGWELTGEAVGWAVPVVEFVFQVDKRS